MLFCGRRRGTALILAWLTLLIGGSHACSRAEQPHDPGAASPPQGADPQPGSDDIDPRPKIVCLGDSLTSGLGLVQAESYPSVLQRKVDAEGLAFDVVNAGVSGDTSAGGLRRLDWTLQGEVGVLVVALGANDALRGLPVSQMRANLAAIIERARERGVRVILAGMQAPPNVGEEYASEFKQAYIDLARQYRTPLVPFLLDGVAGQSALNQADGIHPNPRGAEMIADTVWAAMRPILQQMSTR